jgi:hypothetical protein
LPWHFPAWTEYSYKSPQTDIRSPGLGLDPGPSEYETGMLPFRLRRSTQALPIQFKIIFSILLKELTASRIVTSCGFGLMLGFIGLFDAALDSTLQFTITHTHTHTHTHTLVSGHVFTSRSSVALPTVDVPLPLGSRTIPGLSYGNSRLTAFNISAQTTQKTPLPAVLLLLHHVAIVRTA